MKSKKGNKIFRKLLVTLFVVLISIGIVLLLVPHMCNLFMYLIGLSVDLFIALIIGISVLGIGLVISLLPKCIKIETVYEEVRDNNIVIDPDEIRKGLYVVNSKTKTSENTLDNLNKYAYCFDNNYGDCEEDEIIDDMPYLNQGGFSRKKKRNH